MPIAEITISENSNSIPKKEENIKSSSNASEANVTIHENMALNKDETELLHLFANSKIEKIKDAIDIGKRFEIQSNLFGGAINAFNISMSELEIAENKNSALEIFHRFAQRYNWDLKNELVMELKSLIYRKY